VITAHEPSRERWLNQEPSLITTVANRHILRPVRNNQGLRKAKANIQKTVDKGKRRSSSASEERKTPRAPILKGMLRNNSSSSSGKSDRSQLVDLVVEDTEFGETERVRARKEGGPEWSGAEPKRFV
jgi:hypothetical protein